MTKIIKIDPVNIDMEKLEEAAEIIKKGGLAAFPTETVYGLGANALDKNAAAKIFRAKGRPSDNPLISHIANFSEVERFAREIPAAAEKLAESFWGGPLTMIFKKRQGIPDEVTAGLDTVAIRLPSHSVANALIRLSGVPIAAPSANLSGSPSPTNAEHCIRDLYGRVDMIIDGGKSIIGIESTVVDMTQEIPVILRPGMISAEDIKSVIGEVVLGGYEKGAPKCPGMKYKHYSPKAEVYILKNMDNADKASGGEKGVCIIEKSAKADRKAEFIYDAGKNDTEYAARLFYLLRKADDDGAKKIYAQMPEDFGIGAALCNRLMKAASGRVLD